MDHASRRYLRILFGIAAAVILPVLVLNLLLGERSLGSPEVTEEASRWQQRTRGVTYPPPMNKTRPFKTLRLIDRLPEINAVIFGASSSMSITQEMFPPDIRIYSFTSVANQTAWLLAEAEYVQRHFGDRVRHYFLSLDWSVGMIYLPTVPPELELTREAALSPDRRGEAPLHKRLEDALSVPRLKSLFQALRYVARAPDRVAAFRGVFLQSGGEEYRCPDGTVARDFDVVRRGYCVGYRYDGSWTFGDQKYLTPAHVAVLAQAAAAPSSKYAEWLLKSGGIPNPVYLQRFSALNRAIRKSGGRAVYYMPALIPGMQEIFLASPQLGPKLRETMAILDDWARRDGVVIVDMGPSERYGCLAQEFLDEHHAYPGCFARILERFWAEDAAGRVAPGIWRPERG